MKRMKLKFKMKNYLLAIAFIITTTQANQFSTLFGTNLIAVDTSSSTSSGQTKCSYESVTEYGAKSTSGLEESDQTLIDKSPLFTPQHRIIQINYCIDNSTKGNG